MNWTFDPKTAGEKSRNPMGEEFFADTQLLNDVNSLVRESIQNSLDAKSDDAQEVLVRFSIGSLAASVARPWFSSAESHLEAGLPGFSSDLLYKPCRYLLVEDFGTTGLCGDPTLDESAIQNLPAGDTSYHYFVHFEGDSNKGDGKQGKWGVGKVVFQKISAIKSLFILSERESSWPFPRLAIGQSVLRYHTVAGVSYRPDGWMANRSDNHMFLPLDDSVYEAIADSWGVTRRRGERGLSIVCPYIAEEVNEKTLMAAVVQQYFVPIIAGKLVVEIAGGAGRQLIDSQSILELAKGIDSSPAEAIVMLANASKGLLKRFDISLPVGANSVSDLDVPEQVLQALRNALDRDEAVMVDVELDVPVPHVPLTARGKATLLMTSAESTSRIMFSREGVIVPQSRGVNLSRLKCIVLIESGPLANLLARAEGPAHENWSDGTRKFQEAFKNAPNARRVITYIRQIPGELANRIHGAGGALDYSIFSRYFGKPRSPSGGQVGNPVSPKPVPPTPPEAGARHMFHITNLDTDGVRITTASHAKRSIPAQISVAFAYKVARGNSFAKYSQADFDLGSDKLKIKLAGATIIDARANILQLSLSGEEFWLEVSGFDTTVRDLEVDISGLPA